MSTWGSGQREPTDEGIQHLGPTFLDLIAGEQFSFPATFDEGIFQPVEPAIVGTDPEIVDKHQSPITPMSRIAIDDPALAIRQPGDEPAVELLSRRAIVPIPQMPVRFDQKTLCPITNG